MKKCFKLIGILLSIASLSACQTEDKIIKLDEKGAIAELKRIQKNIGINLPGIITINQNIKEETQYFGNFRSQFDITSETYTEVNTLTFDLNKRHYCQKTVTTVKTVDYGSEEEKVTQFQNYTFNRYFKDNQIYDVTYIYQFEKEKDSEAKEEEIKIYTAKKITTAEFDNILRESYLACLYVDKETDADEFFTHTEESVFINYTPARELNVPKTYELRHFGKDKEVLYYYSSEERVLQMEDINETRLLDEDKNKVDHIDYSAYYDFKLHNYYFTTLANSCSATYKDVDGATYKYESYDYRVGTHDTAKIDEVDLTGYKKK